GRAGIAAPASGLDRTRRNEPWTARMALGVSAVGREPADRSWASAKARTERRASRNHGDCHRARLPLAKATLVPVGDCSVAADLHALAFRAGGARACLSDELPSLADGLQRAVDRARAGALRAALRQLPRHGWARTDVHRSIPADLAAEPRWPAAVA